MCNAVRESHTCPVQESQKELAVPAKRPFKGEPACPNAIFTLEKLKEDDKSTVLRGKYKKEVARLKKQVLSDSSYALLKKTVAQLPPMQQLAFPTALQSLKAKSSRGMRYNYERP